MHCLCGGCRRRYQRTCPVYRKKCMPANADGTAGAPVHLQFGNGGFELAWFANPVPPPCERPVSAL
jgi:hypothetical protein